MKKTLLTLAVSALAIIAQAQMPQTFGYQVAIRNAEGELLKNQSISVRITLFSIPQADTNVYYKETHTVTTDNFGVATINIMSGTPIVNYMANSGGFGQIIENAAKPQMLVEIDPAGGTNYTLKSAAQLLPVPYAVYAEGSKTALTATNATNANEANSAETADKVVGSIGDIPLVEVIVKVEGDETSSGYVEFLGKNIAVGSEVTVTIPAYSPVYITKIAAGTGTYNYRRDVKLNDKNIALSNGTYIYKYGKTAVGVKQLYDDKYIYAAPYSSGTAQTINGESLKPLYGQTKSLTDTQLKDEINSYEGSNLLYVEVPDYNISTSAYANNEDIENLLVGPFNPSATNTLVITYSRINY